MVTDTMPVAAMPQRQWRMPPAMDAAGTACSQKNYHRNQHKCWKETVFFHRITHYYQLRDMTATERINS